MSFLLGQPILHGNGFVPAQGYPIVSITDPTAARAVLGTGVYLALIAVFAFAVLRGACEAIVAGMPAAKRPPAMMVALHIWSLSHGIASLFARGDAARRTLPMTPEELLEAATLVYLQGLGLSEKTGSAR